MQKYCDIMPDATGWVYVIDGVQSASYHHTYELALEAARTQFRRTGTLEPGMFRLQGVNGEMHPIEDIGRAHPQLRTHS